MASGTLRVVFLGRSRAPIEAMLPCLAPLGANLEERSPVGSGGILAACRDADGVITHGGAHFGAAELASLPRCRVIARAGSGVDGIDLDAATRAGIVVCNAPGGNAPDVADQTMGLVVAVTRKILRTNAMVRSGLWSAGTTSGSAYRGTVHRLRGRTLAIFGLGRVGRLVARRAIGFEMEVVAYDPFVRGPRLPIDGMDATVEMVGKDELFARAHVLTLHAPLTAETARAVGARELAAMPQGGFVINAARGGLIDHGALVAALRSGHLEGAGLDVTDPEPLPADHPLLAMENVVLTAHTAANSEESYVEVCRDAARCVADVLAGRVPATAVNAGVSGRVG